MTKRKTLREQVQELERLLESQREVSQEMQHRLKNTMALVLAMARQTAGTAETKEDFLASFGSRLEALGRSHSLLADGHSENATVEEVVATALRPFDISRVELNGPSGIELEPAKAVALGMCIHELATNAAKYGALSSARGCILVAWRVTLNGKLALMWKERGGPAVKEPTRRGLGTRLLMRGLGSARLAYHPTGVVWTTMAPLP